MYIIPKMRKDDDPESIISFKNICWYPMFLKFDEQYVLYFSDWSVH